jgi:ATP-dependent Lhr-like helicase
MPRRAPHAPEPHDALARFHPPVRRWFEASFAAPTPAQIKGWQAIASRRSALLFAPTGSGKTLAAFLAAIDRLMFGPEPAKKERCRVLYVSPLKALAVDVEQNLRAPLAGIARAAGESGEPFRVPTVGVRSGDTPASERAQLGRVPPDILITTPESLYLLLTSNARDILAHLETVIVDEIHALVATKRGAHLFLSLERLAIGRAEGLPPLQRVGLSATQRPLDEVARLLGGGDVEPGESGPYRERPVAIVDARARKDWDLSVEVPVEDMARVVQRPEPATRGAQETDPASRSIWPSIHPRLVELVRAHRSTMIFVNSRRLAERLAAALNEVAGEELALAHHGSIAKETRKDIEERLKKGDLRAIVATSSLELGLDLGAVDLVVQIEAPPSIASGLQRIGRSGHAVGATSKGVLFPKYRGDLLASAAAVASMRRGEVEETRYPRSPLDVLAQQIVAIVAMDAVDVDALFALVRRAAPFAELSRGTFEGVLDMLSGRYPSDDFAELRPRITWDREGGAVRARQGARKLAVLSGGTIPDRGLYGVYLVGSEAKSRRVGELDEEMVFESRLGDVFLLGASSWRIEEITHDRVLVRPAPGEPGKMPFWHGDRPGRPAELGSRIGALTREVAARSEADAIALLSRDHGLDPRAARNLYAYVAEQARATGEVPSDRAIVIERTRDELGDHRVCLLSPFGARVHAPWASAVLARRRAEGDTSIEAIWSDDGVVFRVPDAEAPPAPELFVPRAAELEDLLVAELGGTSLFASHFRENAARALLLPRRFPGKRSPLWAQRKKAADLLAVASRYGSFPILLETYRECLRDVFDLPALMGLLRRIEARDLRVLVADTRTPSPFASSMLFSYVSNFIYEGDAPLAERRAQALSVDAAQLRELLGEAELRELLDAGAIAELARSLQRLDGKRPATSADGVHDLLLSIGDLTRDEVAARAEPRDEAPRWLEALVRERRVLEVTIAGDTRFAAVEDAARLRDGVGVALPRGAPKALLEPVADPLGDLVARYARTHAPFHAGDVAARFGLDVTTARRAIDRLLTAGRLVEGELVPGGRGRELCDAEVLRVIKARSLAKLRREVEPAPPRAYARFLADWQGLTRRRAGLDALLSAIEQLEGAPLPASTLESEILPARVEGYRPADLDVVCAAGEVVWTGVEPLGESDGRIALYLADHHARLADPPREAEGELAGRVREALALRGASFFADLLAETGAFSGDLLTALWAMVWAGEVTNDTFAPVRGYLRGGAKEDRHPRRAHAFRSRRLGPPGSEGRWSLAARPRAKAPSDTERLAARARSLLDRYGVLTREAALAEGLPGGYGPIYDVLKAMEQAGRVRRGYFVAGLGATQFALPGADDRLRAARDREAGGAALVLAATDPASPYGAALPWPEREGARPQRAAGARVVLIDGALVGFLGRGEKALLTFLPGEEPERGQALGALAGALAALVDTARLPALLLAEIDGEPAARSPLAAALVGRGFVATSKGLFRRAGGRSRAPRP